MRAVLIVLAAAVAIGVACVVVYCRRRRLAQAALEETRRAAESLLIPESSSHHEEEGTGDSHKEINSLAVETAAHDAHEAEAGRTSEKALAASAGGGSRLVLQERASEAQVPGAEEQPPKTEARTERSEQECRAGGGQSQREPRTEETRQEEHRFEADQQRLPNGEQIEPAGEAECLETGAAQEQPEPRSVAEQDSQEVQEEAATLEQEPGDQQASADLAEKVRREREKGKQQAGAEEGGPAAGKLRGVKPEETGPRRQAAAPGREGRPSRERQFRAKPDIVCWERHREWVVAVEVPEELLEDPELSVFQNGSGLAEDEGRRGCWPLEVFSGEVMVRFSEDEARIPVGEGGHLLFRLSGQNEQCGRLLKSTSCGSYLAVVLEDWMRDEEASGPPPSAPEAVSLPGCLAHFFTLEEGDEGRIAFTTPASDRVLIPSKARRFELTGNRLPDASVRLGPLFGKTLPGIRAACQEDWDSVGTVVVGAEGLGAAKWNVAFAPKLGQTDQDLPAEIAARQAGWYFVRFRSPEGDLIDSLDFRFVAPLERIAPPPAAPLPLEGGHPEVTIELLHRSDFSLQLLDPANATFQIANRPEGTVITIPANPAFDKTCWLVGPHEGPSVQLVLLVERVWWALAEDNRCPVDSEWRDRPLALSYNDLAATSSKAVWVRLPMPRWVDTLLAGFERSRSRTHRFKVGENAAAIPLRQFADSQEVGARDEEHVLRVWIERGDGLAEAVVAVLPAERSASPPPPFKLAVSAPRLASALGRLRKLVGGPLRMLINEVRREYFEGAGQYRHVRRPEFVERGLCVISLCLDREDTQLAVRPCGRRWVARARLAAERFPGVLDRLRNRHQELEGGRGKHCIGRTA